MMNVHTRVDEPLADVNVIPLADVSLVLLILMMVLSPMIMQSMIKVQATKATAIKALAEKPPEPPLILLINPDGLLLNSVKISTELDLASRLAQALGQRDDKTVLITADPAVLHGKVVEILDLVKQQGAEKIALLKKAVPAGGAAKGARGKS
jgi:biopolymer transport protein ExbD